MLYNIRINNIKKNIINIELGYNWEYPRRYCLIRNLNEMENYRKWEEHPS
jgi:hypothetical protein